MNKLRAVLPVLFILGGIAGADTIRLTVNEAVELAVEQNLSLKRAGIDLDIKRRARKNAWNSFLPSMGVSTSFSGSHRGAVTSSSSAIALSGQSQSAVIGDAGTLGIDFGINLTLPINAALIPGIKILSSDFLAGQIGFEEARKKLERDVQKQFWLLIATRENFKIQESDLELAQKRYEQLQINFDNGLASELDLLSSQVDVANRRPGLDQARQVYSNALSSFKLILGLEQEDELELVGNLEPVFYNLDSSGVSRTRVANRPDIQKLEQQINTLLYSYRATWMNTNTPTLSLSYVWGINGTNKDSALGPGGTGFPSIDPWSDFSDSGRLSIGLNWRLDGLIPGSKPNLQVRELKSQLDSLRITRELAVQAAEVEISNLVNSLRTARRLIEAGTSNVELARRQYELTEEAYRVGTREVLDVETRQQTFLQVSQQLLTQKFQYVSTLLDLQYALNVSAADMELAEVQE